MPTTSYHFSALGEFRPTGDLWIRLQRNFDRLEETKYQPENLFQREKEAGSWPGDTEGRTVLALVLLAQATGRGPRFLEAILAQWPKELNALGYFGTIYPEGLISEQQLSSHGWVLRALAELERWQPGGPAADLARPIIENLILPTAGKHKFYPLDSEARKTTGSYSGTHAGEVDGWLLSSDIGCDFICLDGLVDAYEVFGDQRLRPVIEEMTARFLEFDLVTNHAQTHATLTACRALLRWSQASGVEALVQAVAERYALYRAHAWTESYANYNWFGRPLWTEPCAIVDSLMIAMELWRRTGDTLYLGDAQHIYFNGLGHAQRGNGGFGCDNCPGVDGEDDLFFKLYEAHWCCTMRGGEGLARMAQYSIALDQEILRLPFGLSGRFETADWSLEIESDYPYHCHINLRVEQRTANRLSKIALFVPAWIRNLVAHNAHHAKADFVAEDVWLYLPLARTDEIWTVCAELIEDQRPTLHPVLNGVPRAVRFRGPLLLGQVGGSAESVPIFDGYRANIVDPAASRRRLLMPAAESD